MKRIAVIVPAYNEESAVAAVVDEINALNAFNRFHADAVVVNDCSRDKTAVVVSSLNCILLDLPVNLGIGGAMQTGFRYAFENGYDYAVQCDGDGQHPPEEITKLFYAIEEGKSDIVIGSRFIEKNGFVSSYMRRLGIKFFKHMIWMYCRITITDSTSGFRMLNRKALSVAAFDYPDEYPEPESIILFSKNHIRISEIPVIMRERQGGVSSIRSLNTLYYMLKVSIAIFFTYIRKQKK
jgi:glycosyltransferase involved in cell wall biosynthesis